MKVFFPIGLVMFLTGLGYGLVKIFVLDQRYGPTSAMLMTVAVLVFLIGLVSEQVAQVRLDRSQVAPSCTPNPPEEASTEKAAPARAEGGKKEDGSGGFVQ
jgi:hypothetical protein